MKITERAASGHVALIFIGLLFILTFAPFMLMLVSSVKYEMQIIKNPWFFSLPMHFENYVKAYKIVASPLINSTIITAIGIAIVLLAGSMASFSFARYDFPFKNILYFVCIALLMIPGFILLIPQFIQIKNLGLYNSYLGLTIPPAAHNSAMAVLLMTAYIKGIPNSLFESARIEGASEFSIFRKIVIPLSMPIFATVAITTGLAIWNNYVWSLICTEGNRVKPVIVALTTINAGINDRMGVQFAGYVLASVPLLMLFSLLSKYFIAGLMSGSIKG